MEFGIYRDGDNNLDASQSQVVRGALHVGARDPSVAFIVEDTTLRGGGGLRTNDLDIHNGDIANAHIENAHDMASEKNLTRFVTRTLDNAQRDGAEQTWVELVDHGGGDGSRLTTDA